MNGIRYTGEPFALGVREALGQEVTVQIAKRWVVKRRFAWLEKNWRLCKNCELLLNTSLHFVHLAFLALMLRRL